MHTIVDSASDLKRASKLVSTTVSPLSLNDDDGDEKKCFVDSMISTRRTFVAVRRNELIEVTRMNIASCRIAIRVIFVISTAARIHPPPLQLASMVAG